MLKSTININLFKSIAHRTCFNFSTKAKKSPNQKESRVPLITCKNKKLDLYLEDLGKIKNEEIVLASKGWQHNKSKGDYFIIQQSRDASDILKNAPDFKTLELNEQLVKNLSEKHDITQATKLQIDCMKEIFDDQHVVLAAETGCGKVHITLLILTKFIKHYFKKFQTHAYLVPIIQKLIEMKQQHVDRKFNSPLALILTPARELAEQIGRMAEDLTDKLDLNVKVIVGGNTKQKMMNPKFEDIDILVGSIGAISKLTTTGIYRMDYVSQVVLDESDTLLDDSFNEKISYYLRRFPFHRSTQLVLVSATMPTSIDDVFRSIIDTDTLRKVVGDDLHKILPYITQQFMRTNKTGRPENLLRIVKVEVGKRRPVIVFSNKTSTCDYISMFLNENGVNCVNVNGDMANNIRLGRLDSFQNGEVNVLSTTDCLGRGINTLRARHIINFDFPAYIADYIHRCGRIGRLGGNNNCIVTNFISSLSELDLVRKIELSARTDFQLENVDANIGKIIRTKIEKQIENYENSQIRNAA